MIERRTIVLLCLALGFLAAAVLFARFPMPESPQNVQPWTLYAPGERKLWRADDPQTKTFRVVSEAVELPPRLAHPGRILQAETRFPEDGWLVGIEDVRIEGGPQDLLHHLNFFNLSRISPLCGAAEHVFASGKEMTTGYLPRGYGYPVKAHERIMYRIMFHNPYERAFSTRVAVTFQYVAAADRVEPLTDVYPVFFDGGGTRALCVLRDFSVPSGTFTYTSPTPYRAPKDMQVVLAGGHIHDYAQKLELRQASTTLVSFPLALQRDQTLEAVEVLYPKNAVIQAGDELSVVGEYDNHSGAPMNGMSMVFLYVVPTE